MRDDPISVIGWYTADAVFLSCGDTTGYLAGCWLNVLCLMDLCPFQKIFRSGWLTSTEHGRLLSTVDDGV